MTKRDYRKEYDSYHSKPEQKKKRAARNIAARRAGCPSGTEAHHKKPLRKNGSNAKSNVSCVKKATNRGWRKGKKGYD